MIDTPDAALELKERQEILRAALDALTENQRAAFLLSKYDGLSNKEIADALEVTVPAVESLVHRAKSSLQKKLRHYFESTARSAQKKRPTSGQKRDEP